MDSGLADVLVNVIQTTVVAAFVGLIISFFVPLVVGQTRRQEGREETPKQRVDRLTKTLREAATVAEEIEDEVKRRQELAEQLQEEVRTYEKLREVNQEEIEAVAQVLGGELRKEGRRSFWAGVLMNFVFFILGVAATIALSLLFGF